MDCVKYEIRYKYIWIDNFVSCDSANDIIHRQFVFGYLFAFYFTWKFFTWSILWIISLRFDNRLESRGLVIFVCWRLRVGMWCGFSLWANYRLIRICIYLYLLAWLLDWLLYQWERICVVGCRWSFS